MIHRLQSNQTKQVSAPMFRSDPCSLEQWILIANTKHDHIARSHHTIIINIPRGQLAIGSGTRSRIEIYGTSTSDDNILQLVEHDYGAFAKGT